MFSFLAKRKRQLEVNQFLRRVIDNNSPIHTPSGAEGRSEHRYNRTVPVLLAPIQDDEPHLAAACFAVTKDVSSGGLSVILQQPISTTHVLVGLWDGDHCVFSRGTVCYRAQSHGGFWQFGIQLSELVYPGDSPELREFADMAERLRPATELDTPTETNATTLLPQDCVSELSS